MLIVESRISGWAVGKGHRSCGYRSRRDQRGWASLVWVSLVSRSARVSVRLGGAQVVVAVAGGAGKSGAGSPVSSQLSWGGGSKTNR